MRASMLFVLVVSASCTTVNSYAVLTPHAELQNGASCFRQCQMVRSGGTNAYLNCVRICPGAAVFDGDSCEDINVDYQYQCMTEHNKSFSLGKTILLISIVIVGLAFIGASGNNSAR